MVKSYITDSNCEISATNNRCVEILQLHWIIQMVLLTGCDFFFESGGVEPKAGEELEDKIYSPIHLWLIICAFWEV